MNTRIKVLAVLMLPLLAGLFGACAGSGKVKVTEDEAEIKFDTLSHDFGALAPDSVYSFDFEFYNIGGTPLHLESAMPSCGCVSVDYPQGSIEPGDGASITAKYNTHNRRPGHFSKTIRVYSNAKTRFVRLTVTGTIQSETEQTEQPDSTKAVE